MSDISGILAGFEKLRPAERELDRRYAECDSQGHIAPNKEQNQCKHCYRHLVYGSEVDRILEGRESLPEAMQPMDAPILSEKREKDVELEEMFERQTGVTEIAKALGLIKE